ncbi:MAG: tetratricopeptide repeat protein [Deltaproteobacteria bacterium]|nr:tetratricopeptide repeat protein [Deltaproteobacteria bacterium]
MSARPLPWAIAGVLAVCLLAQPSHADLLDEAWKRGNEAHLRGDYKAAAAAYEQLDRQQVVSADLYYNLGVTYFRQGLLGRAIWAFERALVIAPDDEDARFNLAQARKLAGRRAQDKLGGAEREALWIRVVTYFSPSTEVWLFCGLYFGCFALLFLRRGMAHDSRLAVTTGAAILGVGAALAGLLVLGRVHLDRIPAAVILSEKVAVKEGSDSNFRTSFEVHGGLRVRVLDREHDWYRVRLANGLEGFVRVEDVGLL